MGQRIQRREFLRGTAGSALGWQLGLWIAACDRAAAEERSGLADGAPAQAPQESEPAPWKPAAEAGRLRSAAQAADDLKQPLLILVLPADAHRRLEHGRAWGELVLHGPPRAVAALATCVIACARMEAVREVFAAHVLPNDECAALVLPPGSPAARAVRADLAFARRPYTSPEAEAELRAHLSRLGSALEEALASNPAALEQRLRAAAAARRVDVAYGAPLFHDELAAKVRGELQATPPSGAAWGTFEPCGVRIDHPLHKSVSGVCGTGYTPPLSRRFLFYLVDLDPR